MSPWMKELSMRLLRSPKRIVLAVTACIGVTIISLLVFMGYSLFQSYELQTRQLIQQRMFGARLAAAVVASELNRIRVFGAWYSQSPGIRSLVSGERWETLSEDMDRVVENLPSLVRLFASDDQGRLWADSPRKPAVHGMDFSHRDWFKGAMEKQGAYLSHAYRRTAEPRIQVASMAFPVHDQDGDTTGIVVFQLSLDTILSWAANATLEGSERFRFIDQHDQIFGFDEDTGHVVVHATPADRPDFGATTTDAGGSNVLVRNDRQTVTVYARVPEWDWGVYIAQSPEDFYASRNEELRAISLVLGLLLILCVASTGTAFALLRVLVGKDAELTRANADLSSANRSLRDFSHAVSHDLRAPLRAMSGFSEALVEEQGTKLDEQGRHYLERIKAGSHKLAGMIEDLLAVAHIPQTALHLGEVDLSRLARDIVDDLQAGEPERRVDVGIHPGMKTRGDPTLLALVLRNLLQNAWKFTRGQVPAKIEFGREPGRDEPVYYVKDNGAGFDPKYAGKLFSMFQRLHNASEFEGTGIGLAAALQAIERHGGRIWAEGQKGEGAVFRFTVPSRVAAAHGASEAHVS